MFSGSIAIERLSVDATTVFEIIVFYLLFILFQLFLQRDILSFVKSLV